MAALHLFVDTNVWLSFFAFSNDDIAQLSKLTGLIKSGTLRLYVSEQVASEFSRNREVKLAESIKKFSEGFSKSVPRFLMDLDEAQAFKEAVDELAKAKNDLVEKAKDGAVGRTFAVDKLVANVFAEAQIGTVTPDMIEKARLRKELGNPPGKSQSLGDQLNWEYLLATVPDEVTLHVVSHDGDYQSAMKDGKPHYFLRDEWEKIKKGELCLHTELKPFLNQQFEIIKLQVDKEKEAAIKLLVESGSFSTTHLGISMALPFFDALTKENANTLLSAGVDNQQIRWIHKDGDVENFFTKLIDKFSGEFEADLEEKGRGIFCPIQPEHNEVLAHEGFATDNDSIGRSGDGLMTGDTAMP